MNEEKEKALRFEEFYCLNLSLQQNAWILWRILKSEKLTYFFPKEKIVEIKTEEQLKKIYNNVLTKANLVIDFGKIRKAEVLLAQIKFQQRGKNSRKSPSFYLLINKIVLRLNYGRSNFV